MSVNAPAQIETLVMPGDVVESHAELENECKSCHVPFARNKQRSLCLDCHEDIAADIDDAAGYHGRFDTARTDNCASCHTDHQGRDGDIVNFNIAAFNHDFTDFPLEGLHADAECEACHTPERESFRNALSNCVACHEMDNVHGTTMGDECGDCHSPADWNDVEFDHDTTGFGLIGRHAKTGCLSCHADQTFEAAPADCFSCHADDDAHDGRSGEQCGNCHNPTDWQDTSFDHDRDTEFPLIGRHGELTCNDCHSDDPFSDATQRNCSSCHLEDDNHDGHFGESCDTCHTPQAWSTIIFDHDLDTSHPLNGAHEAVECTACHIEPIFEVSPEGGCNNCHADDDAHEGTQGVQCADCHNEEVWDDRIFFDHDLTRFPLLGNHQSADCESCHLSHRFTDAPTDCVDCHRESDPHRGNFPAQCDSCHNPVAWDLWDFDHDMRTSFPLLGAHVDVGCDSCHRNSLQKMQAVSSSCGRCHRNDDIHDGEFGLDCGRCHSADSFKDLRSLK